MSTANRPATTRAAAANSAAAAANEIHITRFLNAPVKAVWAAWTDTKQAAHWWGPRGFTITTHSHDLRPGGHWNYTMHGPDGVDWPNTTEYLEVEPLRKLVYNHGGNADRPPLFRVTVLFTPLGNTTQMDMTMSFASAEALENTRKVIKKASGNSTWDRFAEYLEKQTTGKDVFIINRSFDAPRAAVFEMWTNPDHLAKWLPPAGATMEFLRVSIRPGGEGVYKMKSAHGLMYGRVKYLEITPPDRLVYTQQFLDEHENVSRHPLAPTWPETMLTIVTFTDEPNNHTRVSITWEALTPTAPELAAFLAARSGMTAGWTGSLDKLEATLASST